MNICGSCGKPVSPKDKVVAVSGGMDPLTIGHVRMIEEAAQHGRVHVYLNTDEWLMRKKGYVFMPFGERAEILDCLRGVELVIPALDDDGTVCENLKIFKPTIFANGGDRKEGGTPEVSVCKELGIEMLFNIGGDKVQSSSELVKKVKRACVGL